MYVPDLTILEFNKQKILTISNHAMFFYDRQITPKHILLESSDVLINNTDYIDDIDNYKSIPWRIEQAKNYVHLDKPSELFWKNLRYVFQSQYRKYTPEFWDKVLQLEIYYATIVLPILEKPNHLLLITNNDYYKKVLEKCKLTETNMQLFSTH